MKKNQQSGKFAAILAVCIAISGILAGCGEAGNAQGMPAGSQQTSGSVPASGGATSGATASGTAASGTAEGPVLAAAEVPDFQGIQTFSKELFAGSLAEKNPVLSPVSAYLAMSLVGAGANGETAAEFDACLGAGRQAVSQRLMESLPTDEEGMQVALANSAWLDDRMQCEAEWLRTAGECFHADTYRLTLSSPDAMNGINGWVEDHTRGLIKQFLAEPLTAETRLALFNTLYFKGNWAEAFEGTETADRPFTVGGDMVVKVPMMRKYNETLSYVEGRECEGIVLPYRQSDLVFVALKPTGGQTVRQLCDQLDLGQIGEMVDQAKSCKVDLLLPKFQVTFDRKLNDDMIDMGLGSAFDSALADFSGIGTTTEGEPLYISLVRQKAVFIVDEEGTEAAAVTMVAMQENAMLIEEDPKEVHFDEPFLYMILNPETDVALFMGIMDDPALAQG